MGRLLEALVALDVFTHTGSYLPVLREHERFLLRFRKLLNNQ